ncbi:Hypothetical predicted protein [Pelobates cultripes]|uniref:Uncharacterized protein n=1 Tax=Pelobates cultripes TaxID=61616 RepID=A0AAD1RN17_PELCU|nr:Hypothetical predicted protein [Pelobates cultripes]
MADHFDTTVSDKRQRPQDAEDTEDGGKDPITLIFDRFWAKLRAHIKPAMPSQTLPTRVRADGGRENGNPPQGNSKTPTSIPHLLGTPGLRARWGAPQRRWPHKWRGARRNLKRPNLPLRTNPKGLTLDHEGSQARGLRAPALPQLRGKRGFPQLRRYGTTQMRRNSSVRPKPERQQTTGGHRASSDKTNILAQARGMNPPIAITGLSDCLNVSIHTRQAGLCMAKQRGHHLMNPRDNMEIPSRGIG